MKVKDLKDILIGCDDNADVMVTDTNCTYIRIIGGAFSVCDGVVQLVVDHEFPSDWFEGDDGYEIRWIDGKKITPAPCGDNEDVYLTDNDFFGDNGEHCLRFDFYNGSAVSVDYPGLRLTYPRLADLTNAQIKAIDIYVGGRVAESGYITPYDVALLYGKLEYDGLMNSASHDQNLVERINKAWIKKHESFRPILCALYERDIDEITDHDAFQILEWIHTPEYQKGLDTNDWSDYLDMALKDMTDNWAAYADSYLHHIADDGDLEAILLFVGEK